MTLLGISPSLGCNHKEDVSDANRGEEQGCAAPSGECFRPDWRVSGEQVSATLRSAEPETPVKGSNSWTVALSDGAGEPLSGCEVHLAPYMPDHGHGSNEVDGVEGEPAEYLLEDFKLTMPGYWQLKLEVTCPTLEADSVTFDLWLES